MKEGRSAKKLLVLSLFVLSLAIFFWNVSLEVLGLRIHRFLLIFLSGTCLSIAGYIMQNVLKNPLAEPYISGISSTGALGYVLSLVFHISFPMDSLLTLMGILVGFVVVFSLSKDTLTFVLVGVSLNLFASSLVSLIMALSQEDILKTFYILWGNVDRILSGVELMFLYASLMLLLPTMILLISRSRLIVLLSLPMDEVQSFGIDYRYHERFMLFIAFMLTGISVYWTGVVGFVGLIVPHILRLLFGDDALSIIALSPMLSSSFLMLSDTFMQSILGISIPIGILTSIVGVPVFVYILRKFYA